MKKRKSRYNILETTKKALPEHILQIDFLKGLAIISVVLLHSWQPDKFLVFGGPYHVWHAVPLLILIAGFTGSYAYKRRGTSTLKHAYNTEILSRRFKRLLQPYIIYWLIQIVILIFFFHSSFDFISLILNFIGGGSGWGAYFVPVIIQSVLVIPLLYLLALRDPDLMIIVALILDILLEFTMVFFGIPQGITSVLYFRYLFAGALGVWLVTSPKRPIGWLTLGGVISLIYITITCYTPLFSSFNDFYGYSGISHAPAYMWTLILAIIGLLYLPRETVNWFYKYLEKAGKASWHIFLFQMLYFFFANDLITKYVTYPLSEFLPDPMVVSLNFLQAIINIIVCFVVGYGWYILERKWTEDRLTTSPIQKI
ncbi:MAG: acyltransferase family protein [Methanoregulaceae archaeon]|jgi:fucose 4-O-acetylase-like acetyltransferase